MSLNPEAEKLIKRTAAFADAVIDLCDRLPQHLAVNKIKSQLLDAATSVASNYRAACRARSRAEFIAKIGVMREEADESQGWLEMLVRKKACSPEDASALIREANELTAIMNASYWTASRRGPKRK
jgi:four helix bundle protein